MYSVIIRNARIIDGAGTPWRKGDIAIQDDTIVNVSSCISEEADLEVNGEGLYVAPGFIDIHTHSDSLLHVDGRAHAHVLQGVTTNILGQCGGFAAPITDLRIATTDDEKEISWHTVKEYLDVLDTNGISINAVPVTGQGSIRQCVMGFNSDKPTTEQLNEMKALVKESMESGCFGISTGLIYTPSAYALTEELIELTKEIAPYGGVYCTHMRGENDFIMDAIDEAIEIGRQAQVPVQISHLKAMGEHMWGKSVDILKKIDTARAEGIDVTFDQYPYKASACGLSAVLPPWAHVGGADKMRERLADPTLRVKLKQDILEGVGTWISIHKGVGFKNIMITNCPSDTSLIGKSVAEIASERNADTFETCFDLLQSIKGRISIVYFTMCDEDVERIMQHPAMTVGSDTSARPNEGPFAAGKPHPRTYGSFVKILSHYVREKHVLSLEQAVHKMTFASAQRFGLQDRGLLLPGMKADIVLFDAEKVATESDYINPKQFPVGIDKVFVNGVLTVDSGCHTGAKAGRVLRKKH